MSDCFESEENKQYFMKYLRKIWPFFSFLKIWPFLKLPLAKFDSFFIWTWQPWFVLKPSLKNRIQTSMLVHLTKIDVTC